MEHATEFNDSIIPIEAQNRNGDEANQLTELFRILFPLKTKEMTRIFGEGPKKRTLHKCTLH